MTPNADAVHYHWPVKAMIRKSLSFFTDVKDRKPILKIHIIKQFFNLKLV